MHKTYCPGYILWYSYGEKRGCCWQCQHFSTVLMQMKNVYVPIHFNKYVKMLRVDIAPKIQPYSVASNWSYAYNAEGVLTLFSTSMASILGGLDFEVIFNYSYFWKMQRLCFFCPAAILYIGNPFFNALPMSSVRAWLMLTLWKLVMNSACKR